MPPPRSSVLIRSALRSTSAITTRVRLKNRNALCMQESPAPHCLKLFDSASGTQGFLMAKGRSGTCAMTPSRPTQDACHWLRPFRIWRPVLVRVAADLAVDLHVDVGIYADVVITARPDFQARDDARRRVDELMAIGDALWESRAITSAKDLLASVGKESHFAGYHIDEFIFAGMPMTLARRRTGWQMKKINAELREPARVAKTLAHTSLRNFVERCGIPGAATLGNGLHIDFWHGTLSKRESAHELTPTGGFFNCKSAMRQP